MLYFGGFAVLQLDRCYDYYRVYLLRTSKEPV